MQMEVLDDGRIVVAGQRQFLAGSGADTGHCVVEAVRHGGSHPAGGRATWQDATRLACLGSRKSRSAAGSRADLFLFNFPVTGRSLDVIATVAAGTLQFGTIPSVALLFNCAFGPSGRSFLLERSNKP